MITLILALGLQERGGRIDWSHDLEEALRSKRVLMVYFTDDN